MLVSMLFWAMAAELVVLVREPVPASPWAETFRGSCGTTELEIRRPMRPLDERVAVLVNGRPARGDTEPLEGELSEVGAAYRFSITCPQDADGVVYLRWVSGLVGEQGKVSYRAGHAAFRDGEITGSGAEEANEETFWYR